MATGTETDIWVNGMFIQIARDLELIKAQLGIITGAEGDTRYVPGSLLPREEERSRGTPPQNYGPPAQYVSWLAPGFDPDCPACDADTHRCPGCSEPLPHDKILCTDCAKPYV